MDVFRTLTINIIVMGSVAVALLALADLMLTEKQKEWILHQSIRIWNWLDHMKKFGILEYFSNNYVQYLLRSLSIIAPLSMQLYLMPFRSWNSEYYSPTAITFDVLLIMTVTLSIFLQSLYVLDKTLKWLVRSTNSKVFITKVFIVLAIMCAVQYALTMVFIKFETRFYMFFLPRIGMLTTNGFSIDFLLNLFIFRIILLSYLTIIIFTFALFFSTVCVTTLLYITIALLYATEIVIRRVAEYPKGPILGLSALIGAIAGLAKSLS